MNKFKQFLVVLLVILSVVAYALYPKGASAHMGQNNITAGQVSNPSAVVVPSVQEVVSSVQAAASSVQNVACSDNGTPGTSTDDFVSFEVSTTFFSDYSITATFAGSSVPITLMDGTTSATNLMGGVVQHFKIMNGALGTGNFTLTITPVTGTPETLTFANPGTCSTVCTSASTGNTVSYVYDSQYFRGDIQGEAFSLPKFDEGTNRKLTKVTVEYGSRVYGSALIENIGSATAPGKYRIQEKHYGDIAFLGFTNSNAGDIILQSPGYPALATLPVAVNVPAQGSWPGDLTYATGTSTMSRMMISPDNTWLDNYLLRGVNPNTSPNWVTNITGNASHDDDFVFLPVQSNAYIQPALTYTLQADLNKFIGTGAFNGTYDAATSTSSTGSFNLTSAMINNLYAKVTYTYDCIAPPAIDAIDGSQTVSSGTTGTSVLANDTIENGAAGSVTLGATGNATISQTSTTNAGVNIDTATGNVVVSPGTPAGIYIITYQICTKATPVTCDTAQETVTVTVPFCYKPAQTTGTALDTNHGITALGRAGDDNSNWPMVRKGAWTVLEAKTKGFVVNRLTDSQVSNIPSADLREGMMVYNITQDCLQINIDGTATGWRCFNTQTCPD
jgi:hypothetical protein